MVDAPTYTDQGSSQPVHARHTQWAMKTILHRRCDVTHRDDRYYNRVPAVTHMLVVLTLLALAVMDVHQIATVARQLFIPSSPSHG